VGTPFEKMKPRNDNPKDCKNSSVDLDNIDKYLSKNSKYKRFEVHIDILGL
jgi:hypothetical protein